MRRFCTSVLLYQEGHSAIKQRLQQLAEEAAPSAADPRAGQPEDALPYDKVVLHSKLDKIAHDPSNYEYVHQQAIGISTLPASAPKHSRDLAMSKPWSGTESHIDSSNRMLQDSIKPLNVPATRRTRSVYERLGDARESVLDYQLEKVSERKQKTEEEEWREMYKERLVGPSMFLNDSFASVDNSIKSLADQRIMEAQRRGEFKNIKRGEPLKGGYGSTENMFIDRTEYHLNEILKKQDALPPWIEKQGGCDMKIAQFRDELDKDWLEWAINHISVKYPGKSPDNIAKELNKLAANEAKGTGDRLRSEQWLYTRGAYFKARLRDLNDTIRGYNLQAPLASQKLYLLVDKEYNGCYKRVAPLLSVAYKRHVINSDSTSPRFPSINTIPQQGNVYQQPTESLFEMFKKLF